MTTLPPTIQVGPFRYEVIVEEDMLAQRGLLGQELAHKGLLRLAAGMTPSQLSQTFLHEILHVLDDSYNLGLGEETVNRLATLLLDTIQRNQLDFRDGFLYPEG